MHDPYSTTEKDAGYYQLHPVTPPPPPEWIPKRRRRPWLFIVLASVVVIIAFLISVPLGWQYWLSVNHAKGQAPLTTMISNYTVTDIVTDMKKDGCPCGKYISCPDGGNYGSPVVCKSGDNKLIYGTSIGNAFGSDYAIGIQAADSALWPDPSMDLQWDSVGLWVYNTPMDSQSAFSEVNTQIGAEQSAITQSSTIPIARFHGWR